MTNLLAPIDKVFMSFIFLRVGDMENVFWKCCKERVPMWQQWDGHAGKMVWA